MAAGRESSPLTIRPEHVHELIYGQLINLFGFKKITGNERGCPSKDDYNTRRILKGPFSAVTFLPTQTRNIIQFRRVTFPLRGEKLDNYGHANESLKYVNKLIFGDPLFFWRRNSDHTRISEVWDRVEKKNLIYCENPASEIDYP